MKKFTLLTLASISTFSTTYAQSQLKLPEVKPKVVYGVDDRKDVKDVTNPLYLKLAESTAAMFPKESIVSDGVDFVLTKGTLAVEKKVCAEERFSQQLTGAWCSGFLVGPDTLVTAGHCVESEADCKNAVWVFDYHDHLVNSSHKKLPQKNVFQCKSIVSRDLDGNTMRDYAVIKLDRMAVDRVPLKYRTMGTIANDTQLVVIGHPSGLPTKITDGATVRDNFGPVYFTADLDTFGGNSGSAVFDARTGVIEGILVRGEVDYDEDEARQCKKVHRVAQDGGRGEDVTRITNVHGLEGINAEAPTPPRAVNVQAILGQWRHVLNSNLTLNIKVEGSSVIATTTGFAGVGVPYTSNVLADVDGILEIDFIPSKICKMYLRPVNAHKIEYAYCAKRFTPEAYFTR